MLFCIQHSYYDDTSQQTIHECKPILYWKYIFILMKVLKIETKLNHYEEVASCVHIMHNKYISEMNTWCWTSFVSFQYILLFQFAIFVLLFQFAIFAKGKLFVAFCHQKTDKWTKRKRSIHCWICFNLLHLIKNYWYKLIQWNCIFHWIIFQSGWKP